MKFAYADPPYPGQAKKHYKCAEVNHKILINSLELHYDGWALSTSSAALKEVLSLCPTGVRVGAWVKPFCAFKKNINPAYAWEPLVFKPANRPMGHKRPTARDWVSENMALKRGLVGAKPEAFCFWLFELLGLELGDSFEDLFPGTGGVTNAYERWKSMKQSQKTIDEAIQCR